jgi:hypothetical protein
VVFSHFYFIFTIVMKVFWFRARKIQFFLLKFWTNYDFLSNRPESKFVSTTSIRTTQQILVPFWTFLGLEGFPVKKSRLSVKTFYTR